MSQLRLSSFSFCYDSRPREELTAKLLPLELEGEDARGRTAPHIPILPSVGVAVTSIVHPSVV